MYLTYLEYKSYGGTLDETTFNDMEFEASTSVDWYTFNRLKRFETYPEALKRCMYKLITLIQARSEVDGTGTPSTSSSAISGGVASQSNDGVSISYNILGAQALVENVNAQTQRIINQYLADVKDSLGRKVLYRGIYPDE